MQGPAIQQMRDLLTAWGATAPATPGGREPMGGMENGQIPGMMGDAGFDRMSLQLMIVHHQDARDTSHILTDPARFLHHLFTDDH
jgi:uncharacterized protein (DUF305 family)